MKKNKGIKPFIAGFLCCAVLIVLLTKVFNVGSLLIGTDNDMYRDLKSSYGKYYKMVKLIEKEALTEFDEDAVSNDITDQSLKALIAALDDPYAEYFTAEEYKVFEKRYAESYIGIGLAVADVEGEVVVYNVVKGGPADEAGIEGGDTITAIDGNKIKDSTEASAALSGKAGTEVTVSIDRFGKKMDFTMDRVKMDSDSVSWEVYDKKTGIAHVTIDRFKKGTSKELKLAVKDIKSQGYDKVIIDLRSNGGGRTDEAYKVADYLLPEGNIDVEVNKEGKETTHNSKPGDAGIEYVVLVDDHTASASEIVAAAIQDNKGGTIMGIKTYGKGVTQKTHRFSDGSAVKFTVEEYYRPNGDRVNKVGITPDIVLPRSVMKDNKAVLMAAAEELK
ncbi:MAG: S41 family peptidase [Mogibacterium sp.]|nr:S41 family peptidase [Mogibacterium sp.]